AVITRPARHAGEVTEVASRMIQVPVITKPVARPEEVFSAVGVEEDFPRIRSENLKAEGRLLIETETAVEAAQLVVLLDEVVAGGDQSQVPFLADVALEAQDADVSVLVQKTLDARTRLRIVALVLAEIARRFVRSHQQPEAVAPATPGQLERVIRIDYRTRVDGLQRRLKKIAALEKEGPLLFEKDREALVGRDHGLVGFDLGEIRIDRGVERDGRRQAELRRQAGIELHGLIDQAARIGLR